MDIGNRLCICLYVIQAMEPPLLANNIFDKIYYDLKS